VRAENRSFRPLYTLWSDAAEKDRYVSLPAGTTIDTTDPNHWIFPVGTRAWKSFTRDGVLVETRLLEKTSAGDGGTAWSMRTFVWNAAHDGVEEVMDGLPDALGTAHDVPSQRLCTRCHGTDSSDVLRGFGAIQLNHALGGVTLSTLRTEGLLSADVDPTEAVVPGDDVTRTALGYLHANCGNCHGGAEPIMGLRLWIDVGLATPDMTGTYMTAVDVTGTWSAAGVTARVEPGNPDASAIAYRMGMRAEMISMPPIASEDVDPTGTAAVRAWISSLPPTP
jgi:hypothetical protein